jgi:hypothetical protein
MDNADDLDLPINPKTRDFILSADDQGVRFSPILESFNEVFQGTQANSYDAKEIFRKEWFKRQEKARSYPNHKTSYLYYKHYY